MIKKSFILIVFGLLCLTGYPNLSDAALGSIISNTHTHTNVLKLKPASLDGSFKIASVCFLGVGDCPQGGFDKGDEDYNVDTAKQCMNEGYIKNNCNSAQEPDTSCPYNSSYVKGCKCKTGLVTCTSPKIGVGPSCGGKYASCTCPSSISLSYPNDRCAQYCDGSCIAKTCSPNASESGCSYGTQSCSNGCGGTRSCCKPCYPYSDESGCSYGTYSCSNGCGGTRRCCSSCSSYSSETGCSYGTYSCSDGCGGTRTCCSSAPPPPANPCNSVTAVSVPSNASCTSYYSSCSSKCSGWSCNSGYSKSGNSCVKNASPCDSVTAVSVPSNASCSSYHSSCSSKCSSWSCNSGYKKSGNSCVKNASCADGGYYSSIPSGRTCTSVSYNGLSCYTNCQCKAVPCTTPARCRSYTGGTCNGTITSCRPYWSSCEYGAAEYYCCP